MFRSFSKRAGVLLAVVGAVAVACGGKSDSVASNHLENITFPLFSPQLEAEYSRLRSERWAAGNPETVLTDKIDWALSLDEAFTRGVAEDKPVLLVAHVRENGDPLGDV